MFARIGAAFRAVRIRRGWRQADVAGRAAVSRAAVSRAERSDFSGMKLDTLLRIATALDIRLDVRPHWRGGDLDRLLDARHAALAERVARFLARFPGWVFAPEVSFAIYADRGRIDLLAWRAATRSLLVIELKTEITDVQDTLGTLDMKRRRAKEIARGRGWDPASVSVWLVVSGSRTNRRRIAAHRTVLRSAFPDGRQAIRRWLASPVGTLAALVLWPDATGVSIRPAIAPVRRVRRGGGATVRASAKVWGARRGLGGGRWWRQSWPNAHTASVWPDSGIRRRVMLTGRAYGRIPRRLGGVGMIAAASRVIRTV